MKILTITFLCLISFNSFSNDDYHKDMEKKIDKMSFEDGKKMKLEMLDKHTTMIEKERACINVATNKPALKKCMKEMCDDKDNMKEEMENKMKDK